MLDAHDSEHMSTGKHIAEGINRASYDGLLMFLSPLQKIDFITAQAGRMNLLRLANGRLEARLPIHTPDYQHPEAIITTALAGALYGLNVHTKSDIANDPTDLVPARAIKRAVFRATDKKYEDTLHLLNTMKSLDGGKRYMVDRKDAEHNLANILQELGTVDIYHIQQIRNTQLRAPFSDESRKELRKLFSLIGGLNKTHIDEKSVAFFPPYEWLGKHIQLADVFDSFEIENIYAVGKTKNQQRIAAERVGRLSTSNALGTTLSPEFFETLKTKAKKEFGEPSADDMRHVQELNAMITGAATKLARRERTEQQDVYR